MTVAARPFSIDLNEGTGAEREALNQSPLLVADPVLRKSLLLQIGV